MKCRHPVVRFLKTFHRSNRGAAAIELAVVLPLLALLAIGVAEFGRLYFTAITVANAARAGAQYGAQSAITSSDFNGMDQAARNDAADLGIITPSSSRFCLCPDGSVPACTGTCAGYGVPEVFVQTSASKMVTFLMRYPGLPSTITVSRTATFRVQ
jgi:Flp pilus assembly pilin Flp